VSLGDAADTDRDLVPENPVGFGYPSTCSFS
jgi:hypothetical protein